MEETVGFDLMGGDFAPDEPLKALQTFLERFPERRIRAYGEKRVIEREDIQQLANRFTGRLELVPCGPSIRMDDSPVQAVQTRRNSSIVRGIQDLATGKTIAFASAGSTGALLVAGIHLVGKIPGVERPALFAYLPRLEGRTGILIDAGANVQCRPEHLESFARLGSTFCELLLGYEKVRVGLLTVGEEKGKGDAVVREAYRRMEESARRHGYLFVGNVEGRDLFTDRCDVIVCDGFTGNVLLKALESLVEQFMRFLQKEMPGYLQKTLRSFHLFRWESYGAVPILGLQKPILVGHGISREPALVKMLEMAYEVHRFRLVERIASKFGAISVKISSGEG